MSLRQRNDAHSTSSVRPPTGSLHSEEDDEFSKRPGKPWWKLVVALVLLGVAGLMLSVDCPWHFLGLHDHHDHSHDHHHHDHHHHDHDHDHHHDHEHPPANLLYLNPAVFNSKESGFVGGVSGKQRRILHLKSDKASVSPSMDYLMTQAEHFGFKMDFTEVKPSESGYDTVDFGAFDAVLFTVVEGDKTRLRQLIEDALARGLNVAVVGSPLRTENYPGSDALGHLQPGKMVHDFPPLEVTASDHPVMSGVSSVTSQYKIRINCAAKAADGRSVVLRWHDNGNPAVAATRVGSAVLSEFGFYIGTSLSEDGTRAVFNALSLQAAA